MPQYHLRVDEGEIGRYVFLPGDPGRCELIAARFENARRIRSNREFTTYTGTLDHVGVSVVSTGIGGPSTAIAIEELHELGTHTIVRVGTCGAMREELAIGDVVIVQASVRDEGTSHQYMPPAVPAVPAFDVVAALREAASARGVRHHVGVAVSTDSFYAQRQAERMPVGAELAQRWESYRRSGAIAAEMETAAVFVVGASLGMRTGAVLAVIDRIAPELSALPQGDLPLDALIDVGVDAMRRLIARDGGGAQRV